MRDGRGVWSGEAAAAAQRISGKFEKGSDPRPTLPSTKRGFCKARVRVMLGLGSTGKGAACAKHDDGDDSKQVASDPDERMQDDSTPNDGCRRTGWGVSVGILIRTSCSPHRPVLLQVKHAFSQVVSKDQRIGDLALSEAATEAASETW